METFFHIPQENDTPTSVFQKLESLVSSEELDESAADDDGILSEYKENHND
jgi:hypothetical protein